METIRAQPHVWTAPTFGVPYLPLPDYSRLESVLRRVPWQAPCHAYSDTGSTDIISQLNPAALQAASIQSALQATPVLWSNGGMWVMWGNGGSAFRGLARSALWEAQLDLMLRAALEQRQLAAQLLQPRRP